MLQGYSRYSLRETLHFGADFPGLDNNDCVGDARRPDEAMVVAVTSACAFPISSRSETAMQATALRIVTTKSRRLMGVFASGRKTTYHQANSARYCASRQFCPLDFRSGSWSCDNAAAGSLTSLGCDALCSASVFEHIFRISTTGTSCGRQPPIVSVLAPCTGESQVRALHAPTAAIIGLMPIIFSTRVIL